MLYLGTHIRSALPARDLCNTALRSSWLAAWSVSKPVGPALTRSVCIRTIIGLNRTRGPVLINRYTATGLANLASWKIVGYSHTGITFKRVKATPSYISPCSEFMILLLKLIKATSAVRKISYNEQITSQNFLMKINRYFKEERRIKMNS
jgi:hypothetical protein